MPRLSVLALAMLAAAAACGKGVDPVPTDGPPDPTGDGPAVDPIDPIEPDPTICEQARQVSDYAWIETHILVPSCATSSCHGGASPAVDLDLSAGVAYPNLVNKGASTQGGWTRVVPGSPSTSYLVVSLGRAPGPPPRDGFMPLLADPLCVEKLEAIERWIAAGAQP